MPWGMERTFQCRVCGRQREPDELFSARGKCRDCGLGRMVANATQLHEHSGPLFEHWRRRGAASYGAVILDDLVSEA